MMPYDQYMLEISKILNPEILDKITKSNYIIEEFIKLQQRSIEQKIYNKEFRIKNTYLGDEQVLSLVHKELDKNGWKHYSGGEIIIYIVCEH